MTAPSLSVVIPTKNGALTLGPLLESVRRQHTDRPAEIIVVDSGSTDGTRDLAQAWADQVLDVAADQFNHGITRNVGIGASHGKLVVLLVQDALPASDDLFRELTRPMVDDDTVAGTFARQVARPDASAIARYYLDQWVASNGMARTAHLASRIEYEALDPMQRFRLCAFDNVCACIRRSVWETHPFVRTPIAEDVEWGRAALLTGRRLVYNPNAVVVHSHDRTVAYEFERHAAPPRTAPPALRSADHFHCASPRPGGRRFADVACEVGTRQPCASSARRRTRVRLARWPVSWCPRWSQTSHTDPHGADDMKVLIVVHGFPPHAQGGSEIFADLHARTLHEQHGDTVYVLTREHDPTAREYRVRTERRTGVTIGWINNTFRSTRTFAETYDNDEVTRVAAGLVEAFEPDVAHVHHLTCLSTGIVPLLARAGVPCFFTLHDYWLLCHRGQLLDCDLARCAGPEPSGCRRCVGEEAGAGRAGFAFAPAWRRLERSVPAGAARTLQRTGRRLARVFGSRDESAREATRRLNHMRGICGQVTHFFAPSASIRQRHIEFGIEPDRISHAPYGFDHRPFRQATRTASDTLRVGFLGSLMVSKAPHLLLEAFHRLAPSSASLELFGDPVAYHGDDSYRDRLAPLMRAPGVRRRGPVPHEAVPAALASLDVLVVPSVWPENSPLVIQEAFLAGVPVVASSIGGIPEVVADGVNGLLFEPGSRADLEQALRRLLEQPDLLPRLRRGLPEVRTIGEDVAFTRHLYSRHRNDQARGTPADGEAANRPAARMPARRITAVVLNYAAADETVMAVRSLLASRRTVDELVVVDNDTTPTCQDLLSSVRARITYLPTGRNLGFSGGMNVGIRHALERGATDLLLVNSDVIVPPDALGGLLRVLGASRSAAIVGPVVMSRGEPDRVGSLGMRYHRATGRMRHIGVGQRLTSRPADSPVDAVSGCFMLIRREVFERVGLFDEEYFFSFEDLEFCQRAARAVSRPCWPVR